MGRTLAPVFRVLAVFMTLSVAGDPASARERLVDGIMDNSFLVEEAYNQEEGVVQHIFPAFTFWFDESGATARDSLLAFTQEWPVGGRAHQLSYTIPFAAFESGGESSSGVGDVFLNYRYQAYFDEQTLRAFAPRLSLILPTGDPSRGLGDDTVGCQVNFPYSQAAGDRWFFHANLGATFLPNSGVPNPADRTFYHVGGSGIFALSRTLHVLLEAAGASIESGASAAGGTEREFEGLLSPGLRYAWNAPSGAQLVLGLAAPLGVSGSAPDYGVILYLSYEHAFR